MITMMIEIMMFIMLNEDDYDDHTYDLSQYCSLYHRRHHDQHYYHHYGACHRRYQ